MRELIASITKREWRLVSILALVIIIITTVPLIGGWLVTPEGKVFTGIHFAAPNDWFVYYSYI